MPRTAFSQNITSLTSPNDVSNTFTQSPNMVVEFYFVSRYEINYKLIIPKSKSPEGKTNFFSRAARVGVFRF